MTDDRFAKLEADVASIKAMLEKLTTPARPVSAAARRLNVVPGSVRAAPTVAAKKTPIPVCANLGEKTGERRECPSCGGNVQVFVMGCSVYGQCTIGKKVDGLACCAGGKCPGYKPRSDSSAAAPT